MNRNVLYYGSTDPLPERRELAAGPLSLSFESGDLRYIKLGEREILRRVYVAVRDRHWGTVPMAISNLCIEAANDSFRITFDAEHRQGEIAFAWKATIVGAADGTLIYDMDGVARSTFWRNRIGLCVLHPIRECAGQPCTVEHVDGSLEQGFFPRYIAPHQPFRNMRAISHEVQPGVRAVVRLEGDVFEMEDQRNWTDASYKIYSTPLELPYPVEVREGTRIHQSVTLRLEGQIPAQQPPPRRKELALKVGQTVVGRMPRLGLCVAGHRQPLSAREVARLRLLRLAHLRVDLNLSQPGYASALYEAIAQAEALGVSLEVALTLSDDAAQELKALAALLVEAEPPICAWLVSHSRESSTSPRWVRLAREHLGSYNPRARFGAGAQTNFTELNRARPFTDGLDLLFYALNPQVHAFDNSSLVETLEGQGWTVQSARRFAGRLPIAVTPVTLKPRFAPARRAVSELPPQVDVRQMSLFGAGWTLGSLKYLAENGVYSATYYETTGWLGVMERESGAPLPQRFPSVAGAVFPLYHVFADVGDFGEGEVLGCLSGDTLRVDGLALRKNGAVRVLLANLTGELQTVLVQGLSERVKVRLLDETNAREASENPEAFRAREGDQMRTSRGALEMTLLPYAVARIDLLPSDKSGTQ